MSRSVSTAKNNPTDDSRHEISGAPANGQPKASDGLLIDSGSAIGSKSVACSDSMRLYRDFMHISHFLRHGHGEPALKTAPGQQRVLSTLGETGPLSQRDLAKRMGIAPASLSELLTKLEERGLVTRERLKEDRRVIVVKLSRKGAKQAESLMNAESRIAEEVFGMLSEADRERLAGILAAMIDACDSPAHPGPGK